MSRPIRRRAAAKINLSLRVLDARPDGYHPIESLMQKVALYDDLCFSPQSSGINLICTGFPIPGGQGNLILRAARALAARLPAKARRGVRIEVIKKIPVAAGLGGGSADAAVTLAALNRLWKMKLPKADLVALAADLGSDLPFFLGSPTAWVTGIGENVAPKRISGRWWAVLAKPPIAVRTAWAYRELDRVRTSEKGRRTSKIRLTSQPLLNKMGTVATRPIPLANLLTTLHNDLEVITVGAHPVVGRIRRQIEALGAARAMMSGSGPTVFGLFDSLSKARRAARVLRKGGLAGWVWVGRLLLGR